MKVDIRDFIGVFENAVSDEWCDKAIDWYNFLENKFPLDILNRQDYEHSLPLKKKNNFVFMQQYLDNPKVKNLYIDFMENSLMPALDLYFKRYYTLDFNLLNQPQEIKLQKTLPEEGYHVWHYEHSSNSPDRVLVYMAYLNDIEEGGETEFLYQRRRIKPKKGTITIFPPTFTHTHRGNPPLSGEKYAITGWIYLKSKETEV